MELTDGELTALVGNGWTMLGGPFDFQGDCQLVCPPTPPESWDCDGFGHCFDPGDGSGAYSTQAECIAACPVPPPPPPPPPPPAFQSWNCVGGACVGVLDTSGTYSTLLECQGACLTPPPPPPPGPFACAACGSLPGNLIATFTGGLCTGQSFILVHDAPGVWINHTFCWPHLIQFGCIDDGGGLAHVYFWNTVSGQLINQHVYTCSPFSATFTGILLNGCIPDIGFCDVTVTE